MVSPDRCGSGGVILCGVDTKWKSRQGFLRDVVAEENILKEGIHRIGFLCEDAIGTVEGDLLGVGRVRGDGVDRRKKILIKEDLR